MNIDSLSLVKRTLFFNLLIDTDSWVIDNDWKDNTVPVA